MKKLETFFDLFILALLDASAIYNIYFMIQDGFSYYRLSLALGAFALSGLISIDFIKRMRARYEETSFSYNEEEV